MYRLDVTKIKTKIRVHDDFRIMAVLKQTNFRVWLFPKIVFIVMALAAIAIDAKADDQVQPGAPATKTPIAIINTTAGEPDGRDADLPPAQVVASANEQYTAGRYASALERYESLMARGWMAPSLYFNAGNAAAQLNRKALAVLYYERALAMNPRDPDVQYNLRLVAPPDNFQPVFILFRPVWFVRHQLRGGELFGLAAGFYILGNIALALAFAFRRPGLRRVGRWSGAAALGLAIFFCANLYAIHHERQTAPLCIVMQPAVARSGPGENFKSVLELPEGLKIHDIGPASAGWREIRLLTGQTAFLPAAAVTPILP